MSTLYEEAADWCARLARDRSQSSWSIRFTPAHIAATPATQLAWRAHCVIKVRLGKETPPGIIWAKAEDLLRGGWGRPAKKPPPKPPPKPLKPKPPKPPKPQKSLKSPVKPPKQKDPSTMAKKQTRRSISVSKKAYERAKAFAEEKGVSLAQLTELALEHFYQSGGAKK